MFVLLSELFVWIVLIICSFCCLNYLFELSELFVRFVVWIICLNYLNYLFVLLSELFVWIVWIICSFCCLNYLFELSELLQPSVFFPLMIPRRQNFVPTCSETSPQNSDAGKSPPPPKKNTTYGTRRKFELKNIITLFPETEMIVIRAQNSDNEKHLNLI